MCAPVKYSDSKPPRMIVCFKPATKIASSNRAPS
jgi:hypothetical protein